MLHILYFHWRSKRHALVHCTFSQCFVLNISFRYHLKNSSWYSFSFIHLTESPATCMWFDPHEYYYLYCPSSHTHAHVWITSLVECLDRDRRTPLRSVERRKVYLFWDWNVKKVVRGKKGSHVATRMEKISCRQRGRKKNHREWLVDWLKTYRTTFFTHPVNKIIVVSMTGVVYKIVKTWTCWKVVIPI